MTIYELAKQYWKTVPQGTEVTVCEMVEKFSPEDLEQGIKNKTSKNISSFLCKQVKTGKAKKYCRNNINTYKKLNYPAIHKSAIKDELFTKSTILTSTIKPEPNSLKDEFDELKLGRAIFTLIDEYKQEITSIKDQHHMIVQEIKTMKIAYQQAQEKIIELNQKLNDRKLRSFKLEDLQNVIKP